MAKIARVERMTDEELSSGRHEELVEALVDIVSESFLPPDRQTVRQRVLFRDPGSRFILYSDADGRLLGFCSYGLKRIEADGRTIAILDSGMYFKRGSRGIGLRATWDAFVDVIGFKLRHPMMPLYFVGAATTPAMYRLVCHFYPRIHPNRHDPPPDAVSALVAEAMKHKGYLLVDDDPWRVHIGAPVRLTDEDRIKRFVEHTDDPDVDFFLRRNPHYLEGNWLSIYAPITIHGALGRLVALPFKLGHQRFCARRRR